MSSYVYKDNLQSERLHTRFLDESYIEKWIPFIGDADSVKFFPWLTQDNLSEKSTYWISRQLIRYKECRYGMQAIYSKETNEFLGQCGLLLQEVDGEKELEVGYHFFKEHRGKGYAPEAAKIFIDFVFKNNLAESVISLIDINNNGSIRVAEKNGLHREKQTIWNEMNVFVYRINKSTN